MLLSFVFPISIHSYNSKRVERNVEKNERDTKGVFLDI